MRYRRAIGRTLLVAKTVRLTKSRHRRGSISPRRSVTRREYAELAVRLGAIELQAQRNRAAIELQAERLTHLQEQVNALTAAAAGAQALSQEGPAAPLTPTTRTVES
jgi:hypothetical protein